MKPRAEWLDVDYYEVLGVSPTATSSEITKAYKKLAKRYHPDTNPGPEDAERFKDIAAAYQVIGDESARVAYDEFRAAPQPRSVFREEPTDYADLFASGIPFGFAGGWGASPVPGADVQITVTISFIESIKGCERTLSYHLIGDAQPRRITTRIPAGVNDGQKVRVPGGGGASAWGGPPGDLYVLVDVAPHTLFTRRGDDLSVTVPITFAEAVLGGEIDVPTLDAPITIKIPPYTSNGKKFRVKGRGVRGGQLYVTVEVLVPQQLSAEDLALIDDLDDDAAVQARRELLQAGD